MFTPSSPWKWEGRRRAGVTPTTDHVPESLPDLPGGLARRLKALLQRSHLVTQELTDRLPEHVLQGGERVSGHKTTCSGVKMVLAPTSVSRDIWDVAGRTEEAWKEGKSGQKRVEEEEGYSLLEKKYTSSWLREGSPCCSFGGVHEILLAGVCT